MDMAHIGLPNAHIYPGKAKADKEVDHVKIPGIQIHIMHENLVKMVAGEFIRGNPSKTAEIMLKEVVIEGEVGEAIIIEKQLKKITAVSSLRENQINPLRKTLTKVRVSLFSGYL